MAKIFATFALTGDTINLLDGPDGDYRKHRKTVLDARTQGTDGADEIWMVDLKRGMTARAKKATQDLPKLRAKRAAYRESLKTEKAEPAKAEAPKPAPKAKAKKS